MASTKRQRVIELIPSEEENETLFGKERVWANLMGNRERISSDDQSLMRKTCVNCDIFACQSYEWVNNLSMAGIESFIRVVLQTDAHHLLHKRNDRLAGVKELDESTNKVKIKSNLVNAITNFLLLNKASSEIAPRKATTEASKGFGPNHDPWLDLVKATCSMDRTLMLIDISFLVFTAFHAPDRREGDDTRFAIFLHMFNTILSGLTPRNLAACLDSKDKTLLKKNSHAGYKDGRRKLGPEAIFFFERVEQFLSSLRIPTFRNEGYEADDVINSLQKKWLRMNPLHQAIVLSNDKDYLQLCCARVWVYRYSKDSRTYKLYRPSDVEADFRVRPDQFVDYLCLIGDVSDNVRGVQGIGSKTAMALLKEHDTLKRVFMHASMVGDQNLLAQQKHILVENYEMISFLNPEVQLTDKEDVKFDVASFSSLLDTFLEEQNQELRSQYALRCTRKPL